VSSFDEHERRLAAVEAELPLLRSEAIATRALAAGADQDVADVRSELRAHTRMLTALRETQVAHYNEHKADAAELKADVGQIKADVSGLKTDVAGLTADMFGLKTDVSDLKAGMARIVDLLEEPGRPASP
jgi:chromosome segregation ATPase